MRTAAATNNPRQFAAFSALVEVLPLEAAAVP
jgi:hypothetical protein